MYYVGQLVMFKRLGRYVRAVVVSVDTDFVTLNLNYKQSIGLTVKVSKDSTDLIKFDIKSKSNKYMNTEAFDTNNNNLMA